MWAQGRSKKLLIQRRISPKQRVVGEAWSNTEHVPIGQVGRKNGLFVLLRKLVMSVLKKQT